MKTSIKIGKILIIVWTYCDDLIVSNVLFDELISKNFLNIAKAFTELYKVEIEIYVLIVG